MSRITGSSALISVTCIIVIAVITVLAVGMEANCDLAMFEEPRNVAYLNVMGHRNLTFFEVL